MNEGSVGTRRESRRSGRMTNAADDQEARRGGYVAIVHWVQLVYVPLFALADHRSPKTECQQPKASQNFATVGLTHLEIPL